MDIQILPDKYYQILQTNTAFYFVGFQTHIDGRFFFLFIVFHLKVYINASTNFTALKDPLKLFYISSEF